MTLVRDLERLLNDAREEGRQAGRSEANRKLTEDEAGASLLSAVAEACAALSRKTAGTPRKAFEEAAGILFDGESETRSEMRSSKSKKKKAPAEKASA